MPDFRLMEFDSYGFRLESNASESSAEAVRRMAERQIKARPTLKLFTDDNDRALSQLMWRVALPLAALNLALLRSEEHTSELQSLMRISYAVVWLKKKNT